MRPLFLAAFLKTISLFILGAAVTSATRWVDPSTRSLVCVRDFVVVVSSILALVARGVVVPGSDAGIRC